MNKPNHEPDADPLEARLQTLRLTGFPAPLLERLQAVQPPPVRHRRLSGRRVFTGVFAMALLAALLIFIHPGRWSRVATPPSVVARQPALPTRPLSGDPFDGVAPVPRESLAAYQQAVAQGDEALMAKLDHDAATASPLSVDSKPLSPLAYRFFAEDPTTGRLDL